MEDRINQILKSQPIVPTFFIGSRVLHKLWKQFLPSKADYQIDSGMFKDAFESTFGAKILSEERKINFYKLLKQDKSFDSKSNFNLQLHELVNLTDFINFSDCLSLFEIDRLEQCSAAVKNENAKNYDF